MCSTKVLRAGYRSAALFKILQRPLAFCYWIVWAATTTGQSLSGQWQGYSIQEGTAQPFYYEVTLSQQADALQGVAHVRSTDGRLQASFTLAGVVKADKVILQDVAQNTPTQPRWCLKYAMLNLYEHPDSLLLEGTWTAQGCKPGYLRLAKFAPAKSVAEAWLPLGQWSGYLSQSDRPYGFSYQLYLSAGGSGFSQIISEGHGGSARHALQWTADSAGQMLRIKEVEVTERSDPQWKWCLKQADLTLLREDLHWTLKGAWEGYIEGRGDKASRCAPGTLFLEKPMLSPPMTQVMENQANTYLAEQGRKVHVGHIIQVAGPQIRLRVWDNGVVDGDVATLFLNGKQLLHRHRVTKSGYTLPVKLSQTDNILLLHAESIGSVPPNTVAVSVFDGKKEQVVVLCSNLQESGAVLIRTFRVE